MNFISKWHSAPVLGTDVNVSIVQSQAYDGCGRLSGVGHWLLWHCQFVMTTITRHEDQRDHHKAKTVHHTMSCTHGHTHKVVAIGDHTTISSRPRGARTRAVNVVETMTGGCLLGGRNMC